MIYNILLVLKSLFILPPFIVSIRRHKYLEHGGKILYYYLWVSVLFSEILSWYTAINYIQNHYISNIFIPFEFLCLSYIYWMVLTTPNFKKIVKIVVFFVFGYQIISNIVFWESFNRFNSVANALPNLGLMLFVILYFYELLNEEQKIKLLRLPMFWISSGVLFYVSIGFFLNIFGEFVYFSGSKDFQKLSIIIESISGITYHTLLTIGLWFSKTPQQLSTSSK